MTDIRKELQKLVSYSKMNNDFLYDYIITKDIKYTSNKNGIFINLSNLPNDDIMQMFEYINKMSINIKSRNIEKITVSKKSQKIEIKYETLPELSDIEKKIIDMSKTI